MSVSLYISTDPPVAGAELNNDRTALAAVLQDLTPFTEELGKMPLEQFQSYSNDDLPEPVDIGMPVNYFDPDTAIQTIDALLKALPTASLKQSGRRPKPVEGIISDLQDCRAALLKIQQAKSKFRFHLGF